MSAVSVRRRQLLRASLALAGIGALSACGMLPPSGPRRSGAFRL